MPEKIDELKEEVWTHFRDFQYVFLATAEGNQPRVRPVTLIYFNKRFWITTDTGSAKVEQIQGNSNTEFCLYLQKAGKDCYVRAAGIAKVIKDRATKARIAEHCDFF
ncbi:MAG: pyridoxamine 5'-phosphate oxidase family protein [Candidatus Thermoplasmatota archaeon]